MDVWQEGCAAKGVLCALDCFLSEPFEAGGLQAPSRAKEEINLPPMIDVDLKALHQNDEESGPDNLGELSIGRGLPDQSKAHI